jgi:hypothetical protein
MNERVTGPARGGAGHAMTSTLKHGFGWKPLPISGRMIPWGQGLWRGLSVAAPPCVVG